MDKYQATLYVAFSSFQPAQRLTETLPQLHRVIVSPMHPQVRLTILFDCCHSGSAVELPYVYRPNSAGQVNLVDNVKKGMSLVAAAANLVQGGFTMNKVNDAKMLLGGAKSFFAGLQHRDAGPTNEDGLGEEKFVEDWKG
ncbi:Ca(2+)-dependent cysteine protease, partial [Cryomyces antarcticus]